MTRIDTLTVGGSPMRAIVGVPKGEGPHPAIVVMCHIGGIDAFTRSRCEELAREGYAAAAPDIFHYHPWTEDRDERRAALRDERIVADIDAALDHLIATADADPKRLGILGHCLGGRTALLGAGSVARSRAAAVYYGGRTKNAWGDGPSPFERIRNINGPVIGFFGNLDTSPSPADVDNIEAEMKRCGVPVEFHRYDGAGHAFQDHTSPQRYHKAAADDAWTKTLRFFRETIGKR
jgi:carboxymethylenebutenolidase